MICVTFSISPACYYKTSESTSFKKHYLTSSHDEDTGKQRI